MLTSQKIGYEVGGNVEATPFGGIFAMHRLVTRIGLVKAIDAHLELLKIHLPYHESDHVLTLAYSVLCGGTRLEDVDRLRNDVPLMDGLGARLLPDPTTTGDFLRRFTEADLLTLMDAINSVRPQLWRSRGADLLGETTYLDADGTIVPTTGELKQGMDISYKGIWGYAPLLVTLANTREVLFLVNRPGNAPSHLDAATWIDKAIALVAPHAKRVCLRGDTDMRADRQLRPMGRAGRLRPGHRQHRRPAHPGRGPTREGMAADAAPGTVCGQDRSYRGPAPQPQAGSRHRTRIPQPAAQPRGRGRVHLPARQMPPRLPRRGGTQEHQPDEGRRSPHR
jgi:hypothetical protein